MQITKTKHTEWLISRKYGTIQAIYDLGNGNVSKHHIRKALDFGECDKKTARLIDKYFDQNKKQIA